MKWNNTESLQCFTVICYMNFLSIISDTIEAKRNLRIIISSFILCVHTSDLSIRNIDLSAANDSINGTIILSPLQINIC